MCPSSVRSSMEKRTSSRSICFARARTPRRSHETSPRRRRAHLIITSPIHRFDKPQDFLIYPIRLEDRLPAIGIPLLPGDDDVSLELQPLFDRAYDAGPYRCEIDYAKDKITPRLHAEQAKWAEALTKSGVIRLRSH